MTRFDFERFSSFSAPEESPGFLLWRASTLWRRAIENALKPLSLTHPQFVILATIAWLTRKDERVSQIEISKHVELDPNTTSQIIRSLEKKHLIERVHAIDERSKYPSLTAEGSEKLALALPAVENADRDFFSATNLNELKAEEAFRKLAKIGNRS